MHCSESSYRGPILPVKKTGQGLPIHLPLHALIAGRGRDAGSCIAPCWFLRYHNPDSTRAVFQPVFDKGYFLPFAHEIDSVVRQIGAVRVGTKVCLEAFLRNLKSVRCPKYTKFVLTIGRRRFFAGHQDGEHHRKKKRTIAPREGSARHCKHHISSNSRCGSSRFSFTRTRNVTASRPSTSR